ncbi:GTP pyrophosphokinase [Oceanospirillum beijerinckii]|uniref:GTP pyrophosphokinase n=1 Tax=Oceanospirillum beijerinckii TaxID=64976 RepID=UPI0003F4AD68|nr:hypothetical protein [Oceanospirillum beijerinckii]
MDKNEFKVWLSENLPRYSSLTESVSTILKSLLNDNDVQYLSISGRAKEFNSAVEKFERKSYTDPTRQMTDLSGIRAILFFESDVKKVCEIVEAAFSVDKNNSSNKDDSLSKDKIGYRSVHYVCSLGGSRKELPEYKALGGLSFEIQVRTVLQHAWAELAHDRSYKFSKELPKDIERKLYLYAGLLEVADKGFDEISKEIDSYSERINSEDNESVLQEEINSISIVRFFDDLVSNQNINVKKYNHGSFDRLISDVISELKAFGVVYIKDLDQFIDARMVKMLKERRDNDVNIFSFFRFMMIVKDYKKLKEIGVPWAIHEEGLTLLEQYFDKKEHTELVKLFSE